MCRKKSEGAYGKCCCASTSDRTVLMRSVAVLYARRMPELRISLVSLYNINRHWSLNREVNSCNRFATDKWLQSCCEMARKICSALRIRSHPTVSSGIPYGPSTASSVQDLRASFVALCMMRLWCSSSGMPSALEQAFRMLRSIKKEIGPQPISVDKLLRLAQ